MSFTFLQQGMTWTVRYGGRVLAWPPLLAAATTMGHTTVFEDNALCPDGSSLAHEFYHVLHTVWWKYLLSFTVGRLWGSTYWRDEERDANTYQLAHALDPSFLAAAATMLTAIQAREDAAAKAAGVPPTAVRYETINHPV